MSICTFCVAAEENLRADSFIAILGFLITIVHICSEITEAGV